MSLRRALAWQIAVMLALITSVIMARAFAETPWLMLPFVFAWISISTYVGATRKLGAGMLVIQIVCLIIFYGVVFAPQEIGWNAAALFDGSAIAFGVVVLFDNWLWPDRGEPILMDSLAASVARARTQLLGASDFFLFGKSVPRPPLPPPTSDLPAHMALLDQAVAEGASDHRRAILLAAIMRVARISIEVDRIITTAREDLPEKSAQWSGRNSSGGKCDCRRARRDLSPTTGAHRRGRRPAGFLYADANAPGGGHSGRARRRGQPAYIGKSSSAEIENFAAFIDSLAVLARHLRRPLDEPPRPSTTREIAVPRLAAIDPALVRYCLKVGLCTVVGYLFGVISARPDLFIILVAVITTASPTYGATLQKMYVRIAGAVIGGAVSLLAIIIVSPNFETLRLTCLRSSRCTVRWHTLRSAARG